MQAELNLPRWRTHGTDQPPRTVVDTTVGIPVAGNIEDIEEISPETENMLLEDFLNRCDLIKFARYDATTADSELLLEEATRFVKGGSVVPALV